MGWVCVWGVFVCRGFGGRKGGGDVCLFVCLSSMAMSGLEEGWEGCSCGMVIRVCVCVCVLCVEDELCRYRWFLICTL